MSSDTQSWAIPESLWERLCDAVDPGTAVSRPYERIHIDKYDDGVVEAYVSEPYPKYDLDTDENGLIDYSEENFEDRPKNEVVELPSELAKKFSELFSARQKELFEVCSEDGVEVSLCRMGVSKEKSRTLFHVSKSLVPEEFELLSKCGELLAELEFIDHANELVYAKEMQPVEDDISENSIDLGMAATAYKYVENPHEYWSNCDSLDDFIDMCVSNGADRDELEQRERYLHHFHPDTRLKSLAESQEQAIIDWKEMVEQIMMEDIRFKQDVDYRGVSQISFNKEGEGVIQYTISVGDQFEERA